MIPTWVTGADGKVWLNSLKRYVKGGYNTPDASQLPVAIPAAPSPTIPSQVPSVIMEGSIDGISEIFTLVGQHAALDDAANRMTVQITDVAFRRRLSNREVRVNDVFGSNLQPFFLPEALMLESQQTLLFDFQNNSTAGPTNFTFLTERRKFQATTLSRNEVSKYIGEQRKRKLFLSPHWLTSDFPITVGPGATVDAFFTSSRDSYETQLMVIGGFLLVTPGPPPVGNTFEGFSCQIFDAKTERPLQNQPVPRSLCCGTPNFPYMLPCGLIQEPNTKIHVKFNNLITNRSINVFFNFVGVVNWTAKNPMEVQPGVAQPSELSIGAR
jgi:hypothetical protein